MDNTRRVLVAKAKEEQESHRLLFASSSGSRRRCSPTNSPEFEFWMVRNPSFPRPNLLSADQLFVNGVLLPLHLLQPNNNNNNHPHHQSDPPDPQLDTRSSLPDPRPEIPPPASVTAAEPTTSQTSSKRWTNIFRKSEKKAAAASNKNQEDNKDREKKMMKEKEEKEKKKKKKMKKTRDKKGGHTHSGGSSSAELNIIINLWPFSRSRSAGNGGSRPRMFPGAPGTRKSSSAPCSRSNSAGESKSRKWPSSPGRPGVHLCRSSPVWQARRSSSCGRSGGSSGYNIGKSNRFYQLMAQSGESWASKKEVTEPRRSKTGSSSNGRGSNNNNNDGGGPINSKAKVLNMKVPAMCNGYRNHLRCGRDENGGLTGAAVGGSNGGVKNGNAYNLVNGGNGNIFNFFTKKVY